MGRSTYYAWRKEDKGFARSADKALREGKGFISDMAISQLIKNIQIGNTTSIIFWLKNHHADYNDRIIHEHEHEHHLELTKEEKGSIAQALRNIGLASILKMNDDPRTVEEWEADNKRIEEERKKEIGLSKEAKKKPGKKTLGELLRKRSRKRKCRSIDNLPTKNSPLGEFFVRVARYLKRNRYLPVSSFFTSHKGLLVHP